MLLLFAVEASAQEQLTLEQCREMTIESNYNLKSSREKIASSEDMLAAYRSNNLPNLSLKGGYLYSSASLSETIEGGYLPTYSPDAATGELVPNIAGVAADGSYIFSEYAYMPDMVFDIDCGSIFNVGAQLTQPIYMGGKISNAIKLAGIGVKVAELSHSLTEAEIVVAVDEAFYTTIKVEEMLLAAKEYEQVVEEFHRQISNALNAGMAKRNDVMKVEVRLNEAKLMSQKAENGLRLARMNLCYAVGLPLSTREIKLVDDFNVEQTIASRELDITARPEYAMLERQIEAKELEMKISRSEFLPSVSAIASGGYVNGATINGSKIFNSPTLSGGVMVNVPIFHWGEGRRKTSAARREVTIAENQFEDLTQRMTLELMQAINNYEESILEVKLMEQSVLQAKENMRMGESHYRAGMETIADYLESQALWQKAMSDLVDAKSSQRLAYSKYQKARGLR
ncbi:MAG: TolC family protein [Rikenellaceae bacterium]